MTATCNDLNRGVVFSLPVVLIGLFFIFRGWRAAPLPIAAALATVAVALLLLAMTHVTNLATDVITLFCQALAVGYSLLMVNRFREARAAGQDISGAVRHTAATAGRTVAFPR